MNSDAWSLNDGQSRLRRERASHAAARSIPDTGREADGEGGQTARRVSGYSDARLCAVPCAAAVPPRGEAYGSLLPAAVPEEGAGRQDLAWAWDWIACAGGTHLRKGSFWSRVRLELAGCALQ